MLASRGFDYNTSFSAGGDGNHYHANCDCMVVQGYGDIPTVEGYDLEYYRDIYDRNVVKDDAGTIDRDATVKAIEAELTRPKKGIKLSKQEYARVISAINTNYSRFEGKKSAYIAVGVYIYQFINNEIDDYVFTDRKNIE